MILLKLAWWPQLASIDYLIHAATFDFTCIIITAREYINLPQIAFFIFYTEL